MTVIIKIGEATDSQLSREFITLSTSLKNCIGVPKILDTVVKDDFLFLIEQPIGESLDKLDKIPTNRLLQWAPVLVETLHQIHQSGVVHRDIKPRFVFNHIELTVQVISLSLHQGKLSLLILALQPTQRIRNMLVLKEHWNLHQKMLKEEGLLALMMILNPCAKPSTHLKLDRQLAKNQFIHLQQKVKWSNT